MASVVEAQTDVGDFSVHDLEDKFDLAVTVVSIAILSRPFMGRYIEVRIPVNLLQSFLLMPILIPSGVANPLSASTFTIWT